VVPSARPVPGQLPVTTAHIAGHNRPCTASGRVSKGNRPIFTRLTWQEAMPSIEQLRRRRWHPPAGTVILLAIALVAGGHRAGLAGVGGRVRWPVRRHRGPPLPSRGQRRPRRIVTAA
jgi:hypothetical protein